MKAQPLPTEDGMRILTDSEETRCGRAGQPMFCPPCYRCVQSEKRRKIPPNGSSGSHMVNIYKGNIRNPNGDVEMGGAVGNDTTTKDAELASTGPSFLEKLQFAAPTTGYRIFRLSIELFIIQHIINIGLSLPNAGTIFLVYSLADIISSLFFLAYPTICYGSRLRGAVFFCVTVEAQVIGFVGMFTATSFIRIAMFSCLCGMGSSGWFVNYQTLTNLEFPKDKLSEVAQLRQGFECIGFFLPSICLAILNSKHNESLDADSIIRTSCIILAAIGFLFYLAGAYKIILAAGRALERTPTEIGGDGCVPPPRPPSSRASFRVSTVSFFGSSVTKYFILDSVLLALSNVLFGTMSLLTTYLFGLEGTYLWLAALGVPIGGIGSVVIAQRSNQIGRDDKTRVVRGSVAMTILFILLIVMSPIQSKALEDGGIASKTSLFMFGLYIGYFYSGTFTSAFALWLDKLKAFPTDFVSRANVYHNVGIQLIMAAIFQLQTLLVDKVQGSNPSNQVFTLTLLGPPALLLGLCLLVVSRIPHSKDPVFGWPVRFPHYKKMQVRLLSWFGFPLDDLMFGQFCDFRTRFLARHITGKTTPKSNEQDYTHAILGKYAKLTSTDLQKYLEAFSLPSNDSSDDWWLTRDARLRNILQSNEDALQKRIELIQQARDNITIISWSIAGSVGAQIAKELIHSHQHRGVEVRLMVDAVNLFHIDEKRQITGQVDTCFETIKRLHNAGIKVKMVDKWYHEQDISRMYVVGTHRKIMLVDNKWMITGGRNIQDEYLTAESMDGGYHFHDIDILVEGDFEMTVSQLLDELWESGKPTQCLTEIASSNPVREEEETEIIFGDNSLSTTFNMEHSMSIRPASMLDPTIWHEGAPDDSTIGTSPIERDLVDGNLSVFQLDHKAGRIDGQDIVLSTLLFLMETSEQQIDLCFGYFQLFPCIESTLKRAIRERNVRVRLFTNSADTNDLFFFTRIFQRSCQKLFEMGVEVYVPPISAGKDFCLHQKMVVVDSKAVLIGSWNCIGTSIYYDSEFSVVLMNNSNDGRFNANRIQRRPRRLSTSSASDSSTTSSSSSSLSASDVNDTDDGLVGERFVEELDEKIKMLQFVPWGGSRCVQALGTQDCTKPWNLPFVYKLFSSREGVLQSERGY